MLHLCPSCQRRFAEPGFCPFDGTALVASADAPTVQSAQLAAARAPDDKPRAPSTQQPTVEASPRHLAESRREISDAETQLEMRRRTFPLTPAPVSSKLSAQAEAAAKAMLPTPGTGEITEARARPVRPGAPGVRPPDSKVISRSASDDASEAMAMYRTPRANDYDKLVGQTLDGRYYVEKKIGEGGMGVVFSARHAVIERPLAIKVLKRDAMRDSATIRRFVQEAKAASRIGHPNIVDVTDFGTTPDGMTYSVMELVPGQTLGTAIRLGAPFSAARAIRITAQIARALAAAHDKGITHRDLKPENVFLIDRDGRPDFVKIVDFGIAKVTPVSGQQEGPRLTRAGSVFGTPEYMAPEQAAGRSDTDGRVDIYALGVIFYEMLCAKVPHKGDSMVRTLAMVMLDPIEPPSKVRPDLQIAPDLEAVVMQALVKKREQRYQTMGALLDALEALMPPAVAQSVTGSPVYELASLPPGADPSMVPSMSAAPLGAMPSLPSGAELPYGPGSVPSPSGEAGPAPAYPITHPGVDPARASTPRRPRDEPEFTASDRLPTFDHVFTDGSAAAGGAAEWQRGSIDELVPATNRRWPILLALALLVGGAAGALGVVIKKRSSVVEPRDAGVYPLDASVDGAVLDAPVDAGVHDAETLDIDAGRPKRVDPTPGPTPGPVPGPGPGPRIPETPNKRGTILVQVLTKPEGARLFESTHYRGLGGTHLEEPLGAKLTITCRENGYKPGTVEVVFDGKTDAVLCVLTRIKICINNIKNPFDDCEVDPDAPQPSAPQPMNGSDGPTNIPYR